MDLDKIIRNANCPNGSLPAPFSDRRQRRRTLAVMGYSHRQPKLVVEQLRLLVKLRPTTGRSLTVCTLLSEPYAAPGLNRSRLDR